MIAPAGVLRVQPVLLGALVCGHAMQPQWKPFDQVVGTLMNHMPFGGHAPPVTPAPVAAVHSRGRSREPAPQESEPLPAYLHASGNGGGGPKYMTPDKYIQQLEDQNVFEDPNPPQEYYDREARAEFGPDYLSTAPVAQATLFPKHADTKERNAHLKQGRAAAGDDPLTSADRKRVKTVKAIVSDLVKERPRVARKAARQAAREAAAAARAARAGEAKAHTARERKEATGKHSRGSDPVKEWPRPRGGEGVDAEALAPGAGRAHHADAAFPVGPARPLRASEAARPVGEPAVGERPLPRSGEGTGAAMPAPGAGRARRPTGVLGPAEQLAPEKAVKASPLDANDQNKAPVGRNPDRDLYDAIRNAFKKKFATPGSDQLVKHYVEDAISEEEREYKEFLNDARKSMRKALDADLAPVPRQSFSLPGQAMKQEAAQSPKSEGRVARKRPEAQEHEERPAKDGPHGAQKTPEVQAQTTPDMQAQKKRGEATATVAKDGQHAARATRTGERATPDGPKAAKHAPVRENRAKERPLAAHATAEDAWSKPMPEVPGAKAYHNMEPSKEEEAGAEARRTRKLRVPRVLELENRLLASVASCQMAAAGKSESDPQGMFCVPNNCTGSGPLVLALRGKPERRGHAPNATWVSGTGLDTLLKQGYSVMVVDQIMGRQCPATVMQAVSFGRTKASPQCVHPQKVAIIGEDADATACAIQAAIADVEVKAVVGMDTDAVDGLEGLAEKESLVAGLNFLAAMRHQAPNMLELEERMLDTGMRTTFTHYPAEVELSNTFADKFSGILDDVMSFLEDSLSYLPEVHALPPPPSQSPAKPTLEQATPRLTLKPGLVVSNITGAKAQALPNLVNQSPAHLPLVQALRTQKEATTAAAAAQAKEAFEAEQAKAMTSEQFASQSLAKPPARPTQAAQAQTVVEAAGKGVAEAPAMGPAAAPQGVHAPMLRRPRLSSFARPAINAAPNDVGAASAFRSFYALPSEAVSATGAAVPPVNLFLSRSLDNFTGQAEVQAAPVPRSEGYPGLHFRSVTAAETSSTRPARQQQQQQLQHQSAQYHQHVAEGHEESQGDTVLCDADAKYGPRQQRAYVCQPKAAGQRRPAIVLVRGKRASKSRMLANWQGFLEKNFVLSVVDYRPEHCPEDIADFVEWLRDNKDTYGIDPARVGLHGYAGGGVCAATAALSGNVHVQAVASVSGAPTDIPLLPYWPMPPFFFVHARDDDVMPFKAAEATCRNLTKQGISASLMTLNSGGHRPLKVHEDSIKSSVFLFFHNAFGGANEPTA